MPRAVGDGDKLFILLWWELASSEQSVVFRLETAVAEFYWNFSGGGKKKQKTKQKFECLPPRFLCLRASFSKDGHSRDKGMYESGRGEVVQKQSMQCFNHSSDLMWSL